MSMQMTPLPAALLAELRPKPFTIEFRQQDWIPGFGGYVAGSGRAKGKAFCSLNLGSIICAVEHGDLPKDEVPYMVAETMMHEIIHALEEWAGVEFNETRVEQLLEQYRSAFRTG